MVSTRLGEEFVKAVGAPNQPPVADAGPDQTDVAVGSDCLASVVLNGSASHDEDGDTLTYKWTWGEESATGVNPTIQLPLGTTTITLVVNDGIVNSEPAYVDITVVDVAPPTVQVSNPVCATGPSGMKANKFTVSAQDNCSSPVNPTIDKVEIFNSRGKPVRGQDIYAISGTDIFVYPNGTFSIKITATAADQSGNTTTQTLSKKTIKCR
jgi:hypothetical protein